MQICKKIIFALKICHANCLAGMTFLSLSLSLSAIVMNGGTVGLLSLLGTMGLWLRNGLPPRRWFSGRCGQRWLPTTGGDSPPLTLSFLSIALSPIFHSFSLSLFLFSSIIPYYFTCISRAALVNLSVPYEVGFRPLVWDPDKNDRIL